MKFKIDCDIEIEQMVDWLKEHNYAEVVRYKDCKWFSRDVEYNRAWCNYYNGSLETAVNGYCYRGERRTDNGKTD